MKPFHRIRPTEIPDNVFRLLDKDWMLVTAGKPGDFNTMTASWGHMGILWSLPVAIAYIRPQRYTRGFADRYPEYTLSFFTERYRSVLQFCGSRSGRDCDKVAETGLTVMETERGNVIFEEARLVLECRKIYQDDLKKKNFLIPEVARKNYPKDDFHRFYMGEIVNVLVRQGIPNLSFV
jgi:flavin reductase (DIM6/NTAB) family NADH-FMN oxidoreductase RutF